MRYAKRMLLIPEEVYHSLLQRHSDAGSGQSGESDKQFISKPLDHVTRRMRRLGEIADTNSAAMNADERLLQYQQEFKRYSKLREDADERPVNIHVANLKDATQSVLNSLQSKAATAAVTKTAMAASKKATAAAGAPLLRRRNAAVIKGKTKRNRIPLHGRKTQSDKATPVVIPSNASSGGEIDESNSSDALEFETAADEEEEAESDDDNAITDSKSDDDDDDADMSVGGDSSASSIDSTAAAAAASSSHPRRSQQKPPYVPAETRRAQVLAYVQKYPDRAGLDQNLQVMRQTPGGGEYRAVRGSNVEKFLDYHFSSSPFTERSGIRRQPPGYSAFITNARGDPYLAKRLFGNYAQTTPKTGRGRVREDGRRKCTNGQTIRPDMRRIIRPNARKRGSNDVDRKKSHIKPLFFPNSYIKKAISSSSPFLPYPNHHHFIFKPKLW